MGNAPDLLAQKVPHKASKVLKRPIPAPWRSASMSGEKKPVTVALGDSCPRHHDCNRALGIWNIEGPASPHMRISLAAKSVPLCKCDASDGNRYGDWKAFQGA